MELLFTPLFNIPFTEDQWMDGALFVTLVLAAIHFLIWGVLQGKAYVLDQKDHPWLYCLSKRHLFEGDKVEDFSDRILDFIFFIILWVLGAVAIAFVPLILNILWLPISIVTGIYLSLRLARKVVRINRMLEKHKADPNAHQATPPGDE